MKKALCTAFAAVFFLASLTACSDGISTEYESFQPDTFEEHTDKANENISCRVEVNDMKFTVNGNELWINGTNTPWQNWNDFVGNMDETFWDNELARLADDGINCTRIWISCNGEGVVRLNDNGEILSINEGHWSDLDKLFDLAEKYKSVHDNVWYGIMVWSQTADEEYVWYGYDRIEKAANYIAEYIPDKIYPLG